LKAQEDLKKAVADAQSALNTFKGYSHSNFDNGAKQIFKELVIDMERHIDLLTGRLSYVNQGNDIDKPLS
jgi:bacterioferritin (cytochrome b1)